MDSYRKLKKFPFCGKIKTMKNEDFKIFATNSHQTFAKKIAKILKKDLGKLTSKKFSCGENYVNFDETIRGREVFLIGTTRTEKMNEDFWEIFLLADAAKRSFAKKVHLILPHLAYARQDKIHAARESISAKLIAKLLRTAGVEHLLCLHLHTDQIQGFFDFPVDNLNAQKLFIEKIKNEKIKNLTIVSPDAGGAKFAKKFADELNLNLAILHKTRPAHNSAEISEIIGNVKNKNCLLLDDMVDTAGSICAAKTALQNAGAKNIFLAATHAIFSGRAVENLRAANFTKIFVADSLPLENKIIENLKIEIVETAPLFANAIKNNFHDRSVSKLFF